MSHLRPSLSSRTLKALKITGALGVIKNKENVEVIYGPATSDIKTRLEEYLKTDNNA